MGERHTGDRKGANRLKAWRRRAWVSTYLNAAEWRRSIVVRLACLAATPLFAMAVDPARAAREVYQDQDFWWKRLDAKTVPTSWIEQMLAAIGEFLGRMLVVIGRFILEVLRNLFRFFGMGAASGSQIAVWGLIAAILVLLVWRVAPVVLRWLNSGGLPLPAQDGVVSQALPEALELFEQAAGAFRSGAYAEAIRLALLALIARLEKQGLLRYDTTRTNREYQIELSRFAELASCFGQLARIYERVWYGRIPAGAADAEKAIGLCRSIINQEDFASA
jgi:hypothetical protein